MIIQPNTYVRLIKGVPIENDYRNTIYFDRVNPTRGRSEQEAYFKSFEDSITLAKQSYQRYDNGVITVNHLADNLYGVNYMMFQNTSFGNKWFYAFVNDVEYVSNTVSRVYYEIDVIQTWYFDYTVMPCFVEREHVEDDTIGVNIVPEDISVNDYVYMDIATPVGADGNELNFNNLSICVIVKPSILNEILLPDYARIEPGLYAGVYNGLDCVVADNLTPERITQLSNAINAENVITGGGVVDVIMMPTAFVDILKAGNYHPTGTRYMMYVDRPTTIGGYTPKNNKLFTYPYCCINITNNRDAGKDFAFEKFYSDENLLPDTGTFILTFSYGVSGNMMCYPLEYNGVLEDTSLSVQTPPFPTCVWGSSLLAEWFANNSLKLLTMAGTYAIGGAVGSIIAESGSATPPREIPEEYKDSPALNDVHKFQTKQHNLYKTGTTMVESAYNGTQNAINKSFNSIGSSGKVYGTPSSDVLFATGRGWRIEGRQKVIRPQFAAIIDNYFTMYGYAVNKLKVPSFKNRKKWTYIKTNGFNGHGEVPTHDMSKINKIHDNGITYWDKNSEVGNYQVPNPVL